MKPCPYCAEDIQEAAIACKHCGRDLKSGASHVQLVAPKKRTSLGTLGCAGVLVLLFLGWLKTTQFTATPPTPAPSAATPATKEKRAPMAGSGRFDRYSYTFSESGNLSAFVFTPNLPESDIILTAAMRHILETDFKQNMKNVAAPKVRGQFLRFITAEGGFDFIITRDEHAKVIGFGVNRVR